MLLCLDVGNTHILGGVFDHDKLVARFRCTTSLIGTADQFGIFLLNILQANNIERNQIKTAALCSVVPGCDYTINHTISHYFSIPCFILRADMSVGLKIKTKNAAELGSDLIAGAIGAMAAYPNKHLIIVDMGTATTVCAVSKNKEFFGVSILPGMRLGMESLRSNTAKLMEVNLEIPEMYVGRSTRESIQSGLYYGQLGALKEIIAGMKRETFANEETVVISTGGFAQIFRDQPIFNAILPDLVLQGIVKAYELVAK